MDHLKAELREYVIRYPEELSVVDRFLALLDEGEGALRRDRLEGHLTASGWTVDPERGRTLLIHHRKLGKWLQPGGHADGDPNLPEVARKEALEETGLDTSLLLGGRIFDLDIHPIPAGKGVPAHEHFDVRFLLEANGDPAANHESHEVRWIDLEEIESLTEEASILRMRRKLGEQREGGG